MDRLKSLLLEKSNKKGQVINSVTTTMIALFVALLIIFALFLGISTLNPTSFFSAGSNSYNATLALQDNTTRVAQNFSQQLPTVGTILGVVLILGVLGLLIVFILRFRGASGGGGGSL